VADCRLVARRPSPSPVACRLPPAACRLPRNDLFA